MKSRKRWAGFVLATLVLTTLPTMVAGAAAQQQSDSRVLVFYKTEDGSRHPGSQAGVPAIQQLRSDFGFRVTATRSATQFGSIDRLSRFDAVVFLNTSGDVLTDAEQEVFEEYIQSGGGFVGINTAAGTEPDWEFYTELVGTQAVSWSGEQTATIQVADQVHPASSSLPEYWTIAGDLPNFTDNVRGTAHVLATADESTYDGGEMGHDHPITWCKDYQGGRSFYTGLGGTPANYADTDFLAHLGAAISWSAGRLEGDCGATVWANYEKTILNAEPGEPMGLAVLPDGRVLHNTRSGDIMLYDPATDLSPVISTVDVYRHDEDGLQFVAIDPDFGDNQWVYVYYAPPLDTPEGNAPNTSDDPDEWDEWVGYNQLSRVKFVDGASPTLDWSTEQQILQVPADRGICCHVAGDIEFDAEGLLYMTTGDDTNAGGSDGYTPINDNTDPYQAPHFDARRSAGNTNDLRGALLRIRVLEDGSYEIPEGNLFAEGTEGARPEIYAMGLRNPFRFDVAADGTAYVADYSPDNRNPSHDRGPEGTGRFIQIEEAGNYGWPFCMSSFLPYKQYDFATDESGEFFDCADGPVNESRHNTGLEQTPPVADPDMWYTYNAVTPCAEAYVEEPFEDCSFLFPEMATGGVGPHSTSFYEYDQYAGSEVRFPEYFDGTALWGEFTRDYYKEIRFDENGDFFRMNALLTDLGHPGTEWDNPMDSELGPDGCLYTLVYGDGFFSANPDAELARTCYVKGQRAPRAVMSATPTSGQPPLTVEFSSEGSFDPDPGDSITFAWDFDGNGSIDSTDPEATHTYTEFGVYTATLTVTDSNGDTDVENRTITVGNTAPVVTIETPVDGGFFDWGDSLPWTVSAVDPEEAIDCDRMSFSFLLGHDDHAHPEDTQTGCTGTYETLPENADHAGGRLYGVIVGSYTDGGANGQPALTGSDTHILNLHRLQAEDHSDSFGINVRNRNDEGESQPIVDQTSDGDWISFDPVNLLNIDSITFRAGDNNEGGLIEVRVGAVDGPLLATASIASTGGNNDYENTTVDITDPGGTHELFFVFKAFDPDDTGNNFINLNWIQFNGDGVGIDP